MVLRSKVDAEVAKQAEGLEPNSAEWRKKRSVVSAAHRDERSAIYADRVKVLKLIGELVPSPQRKSFVWLYERL